MFIFKAAIESLFSNLGTAFKVSIIPVLALSLCIFGPLFALGFGEHLLADRQVQFEDIFQNGPGIGFLIVLALIATFISLMAFSIAAIGWHRAILEAKPASLVPSLKGMPVDKYVGRLFLLFLVLTLVFIGVAFIAMIGFFIFGFLGTIGLILVAIFGFVAIAFATSVWYRMASTLPAIAIGEPTSFGDGWRQTEDLAYPIFWAALVTILFGSLLGYVQVPLAFSPSLSFAVSLAVNWFTTMLGLSLLTEIYRQTGYSPNVTEIFE